MHESDQDTKLEKTETHVLTKTDPFKPHEGVPRQDEPENKKELGNRKKVGANFLVESVEAESFSGELEVPETYQLTETDSSKPHEGVPSKDEPENKNEPGNGKKVKAYFLVESVGTESSSGEFEVPETDQLTEADLVKPHEGVPRQDEPENVKEPGHCKKAGAKISKELVEAESSSGELPSADSDLQLVLV